MIELSCNRTVRPELVEGQSRTVPNKATQHHEVYCCMLGFFDIAQNQHERLLGFLVSINGLDLQITRIQTYPGQITKSEGGNDDG